MHINIVKTYAWMQANANSKTIKTTNIIKGIKCMNDIIFSNNNILQANPTITFNKVWPAIKLINNRTPKLMGLAKYDIDSIGTKINATEKLEFAGIIKDNILKPCLVIPIMLTPIKIENDKAKVIIIWLVTVKL